jgi:hypothetical protein
MVTTYRVCYNIKEPRISMFIVILAINVPIISIYSVKWMGFIMDTGGVLCEVGKEVFF